MSTRFTRLISCAKFVSMVHMLQAGHMYGMVDERLSGNGEWWHDETQMLTGAELCVIHSQIVTMLQQKKHFDKALVSMQLKNVMERSVERAHNYLVQDKQKRLSQSQQKKE